MPLNRTDQAAITPENIPLGLIPWAEPSHEHDIQAMIKAKTGAILFSGANRNLLQQSMRALTVLDEKFVIVRTSRVTPSGKIEQLPNAHLAGLRLGRELLIMDRLNTPENVRAWRKIAQSGHKSAAPIQANDSFHALEQMLDLGLRHHDIGSPEFLAGCIHQEILPRLCDRCSAPISDAAKQGTQEKTGLEQFLNLFPTLDRHVQHIRIRGQNQDCTACNGTGLAGTVHCLETFVPDVAILAMLRSRRPEYARDAWRKRTDGNPRSDNMLGKSWKDHAILHMLRGRVDPEEALRRLAATNSTATLTLP